MPFRYRIPSLMALIAANRSSRGILLTHSLHPDGNRNPVTVTTVNRIVPSEIRTAEMTDSFPHGMRSPAIPSHGMLLALTVRSPGTRYAFCAEWSDSKRKTTMQRALSALSVMPLPRLPASVFTANRLRQKGWEDKIRPPSCNRMIAESAPDSLRSGERTRKGILAARTSSITAPCTADSHPGRVMPASPSKVAGRREAQTSSTRTNTKIVRSERRPPCGASASCLRSIICLPRKTYVRNLCQQLYTILDVLIQPC